MLGSLNTACQSRPPWGSAERICDRYRCPEGWIRTSLASPSSGSVDPGIPPDLTRVVDTLTHERYLEHWGGNNTRGFLNRLKRPYYSVRPILPLSFRLFLQRMYFRGWEKIPFPCWPVDVSVERLLETVLALSMKDSGIEAMPFIWFWPDGASGAAVMTHDVETAAGRDFCRTLMEIDESLGLRAAFLLVPEKRYPVESALLDEIRARGHEIDVHDLNHDGNLFSSRKQFQERVKAINRYGKLWGTKGFRSAILYRNVDWFDALEFDYDMSVPNVGHLEAQRGGCCTVFPYFIGELLELPVTTTQDYSLFHVLREHRIDLWKTQARMVLEKHGLLSFITHPDYLLEGRAQSVYRALLEFLAGLKSERKVWLALPHQVNEWWRQRSKMTMVAEGNGWRIVGCGSERARLAYARLDGERLVYICEPGSPANAA